MTSTPFSRHPSRQPPLATPANHYSIHQAMAQLDKKQKLIAPLSSPNRATITLSARELDSLHTAHKLTGTIQCLRKCEEPYRLECTDTLSLEQASRLFDRGLCSHLALRIDTDGEELLALHARDTLNTTLNALARNASMIQEYRLRGEIPMHLATCLVNHPATQLRQLRIRCSMRDIEDADMQGELENWCRSVTSWLRSLSIKQITFTGDSRYDTLRPHQLKLLYGYFHDWDRIRFHNLTVSTGEGNSAVGKDRGISARIIRWIMRHADCKDGPVTFENIEVSGYGSDNGFALPLSSHAMTCAKPAIWFRNSTLQHVSLSYESLRVMRFSGCTLMDVSLTGSLVPAQHKPCFLNETRLLYSISMQPPRRACYKLAPLFDTPLSRSHRLWLALSRPLSHGGAALVKRLFRYAYPTTQQADSTLAQSAKAQDAQATIAQKAARIVLDLTKRLFHVSMPTHADHFYNSEESTEIRAEDLPTIPSETDTQPEPRHYH